MNEDNNEEEREVVHRGYTADTEDWLVSLAPITIAFIFYIFFILTSELENKGLFIAYGVTAGVIGLQTYWIIRGWRNKNISTVVMGSISIIVVLVLLRLYINFT